MIKEKKMKRELFFSVLIVVLIFLVQMIRTREFVSHVLPRPRKALPEPTNEIVEFVKDLEEYNELVDTCTDGEPDFMLQVPTEEEWNSVMSVSAPFPLVAEPMPETLHIDLGSLGGVDIPVPEGALNCLVDPRTYIVRWSMVDGSVVDSYELDRHMRENGIQYSAYSFNMPNLRSAYAAYCTPSRNPVTGQGPQHGPWL